MIPDVDRQIVVDRTFGYALQTFDFDVADGEIRIIRRLCKRQCAMRKQGNGGQDGASLHASLTDNFLSRAVRGVGFRAAAAALRLVQLLFNLIGVRCR